MFVQGGSCAASGVAVERVRTVAARSDPLAADLESVCGGNSTVGSNPTATAIPDLAVVSASMLATPRLPGMVGGVW